MADDMRTLGYICPKCGAQVMGARSAFALEASDAEIECSCGGSVLRNGIVTINTETAEALGLDLAALKEAFKPYCTEITEVTTAESFS